MSINKNSVTVNNMLCLKALEEVSIEKAVEVVSSPTIDGKELSAVIECSLMGKVVLKENNEPLKLSNKVLMAAILNRLKQIEALTTDADIQI